MPFRAGSTRSRRRSVAPCPVSFAHVQTHFPTESLRPRHAFLNSQGRITDFRPDNVLTNPSRSLEKMIVGSFDLQADLSSCVNWNVKQYFLWVTVDYATPQRTVRDSSSLMFVCGSYMCISRCCMRHIVPALSNFSLFAILHFGPSPEQHTVTIWDRLITSPWSESKLELDDVKAEYPVMDHQVRAIKINMGDAPTMSDCCVVFFSSRVSMCRACCPSSSR
jgi:hypothetical protein